MARSPRPRGWVPSGRTMAPAVRDVLAGAIGDANLKDQAIGFGRPEDGRPVGHQRAVYAQISTDSGVAVYDVRHTLGAKPTSVRLVHAVGSGSTVLHVSVAPVRIHDWTETSVRVNILALGGGSLGGAQVTLEIRGD